MLRFSQEKQKEIKAAFKRSQQLKHKYNNTIKADPYIDEAEKDIFKMKFQVENKQENVNEFKKLVIETQKLWMVLKVMKEPNFHTFADITD